MLAMWLALSASAAETQKLTWTVEIAGQPAGERTVTVKHLGERRVIEGWTELQASGFTWKQRLTASAMTGPASFHAVMDENGAPREIQGRRTATGWSVTVVDAGRSRTWSLASEEVDLSTVDFLDPNARVSIPRLQHAKVLLADVGSVVEGDVTPLGASDVTIAGTVVPVQGYAWTADGAKTTLYYTAEGYMVRMEGRIAGKDVTVQLKTPPPAGLDDAPLDLGGPVEEVEL